jgi:hypothetical protein
MLDSGQGVAAPEQRVLGARIGANAAHLAT